MINANDLLHSLKDGAINGVTAYLKHSDNGLELLHEMALENQVLVVAYLFETKYYWKFHQKPFTMNRVLKPLNN